MCKIKPDWSFWGKKDICLLKARFWPHLSDVGQVCPSPKRSLAGIAQLLNTFSYLFKLRLGLM
jgi:hypothetical protein